MQTGKRTRRTGLLLFLMLIVTALFSPAGEVQAGGDFVLRAGHLHTGEKAITDGALVVRDGRVVASGSWAQIQPGLMGDLPILHWPDAYVTPGLVAASSKVVGPHRGQESISAAYLAADGYDTYGDHRPLLETGITTVHVNPGEHRLISGQGAVVKLVGDPANRVLSHSSDLSISLRDSVDSPDPLLEIPFPASSDVQIEPPTAQRPVSRIDRLLALREAVEDAGEDPLAHGRLAKVWQAGTPLRIAADAMPDIQGILGMMSTETRRGYLVTDAIVSGMEAALVAAQIPVVLRLKEPQGDTPDGGVVSAYGFPDLQGTPEWALAPAGELDEMSWAISEAAAKMESPESVIPWVTRNAARILGVADRVGHLETGADADIVVWNDSPWELHSRPIEVFVEGLRAWQPQEKNATVIRAETIWISPEEQISNGQVLIEDGIITAVGRLVPHPPHCQVIHAGPGSFLAPGFIDCYGHLGLEGESASMGTGDRLHRLLGVTGAREHSVALAGITTQLLAPRRLQRGSGIGVLSKTSGDSRHARIEDEYSMLLLEISDSGFSAIRRLFDQGKKYLESWQKYEKDLAEWEKKKAAGEEVEKKKEDEVEQVAEENLDDPLTGIWEMTISGGPIPEPESATISVTLTGSEWEGRVIEPSPPVPVRIVGTLEGSTMRGSIEIPDDALPDTPKIEAELIGEDALEGKISILTFSADLSGKRTSKEAKTFKVTRRKKQADDGRPMPPRVRANLEPFRTVLEKKTPVLVSVSGYNTLPSVVQYFTEREIPFAVQIDENMRFQRDLLLEKKIPVLLSDQMSFEAADQTYMPSTFLGRAGITVGFRSSAGDGARRLPFRVRNEVSNGMAPDAALDALTRGAAHIVGAHDRIGKISEGMEADLLIWKGHPFEAGSRLERVFVNGEEVR